MNKIRLPKKLMEAIVLIIPPILVQSSAAMACDACKKQQPALFQGITHGPGPESNWDSVIVGIMVCITLYVLLATIKCLFKPKEKDEEHIKRLILNNIGE